MAEKSKTVLIILAILLAVASVIAIAFIILFVMSGSKLQECRDDRELYRNQISTLETTINSTVTRDDYFGSQLPMTATCNLASNGGAVSGIITLTQTAMDSVLITGTVAGLTPSATHGFHVHLYGDMSTSCSSMSGHYNPYS